MTISIEMSTNGTNLVFGNLQPLEFERIKQYFLKVDDSKMHAPEADQLQTINRILGKIKMPGLKTFANFFCILEPAPVPLECSFFSNIKNRPTCPPSS